MQIPKFDLTEIMKEKNNINDNNEVITDSDSNTIKLDNISEPFINNVDFNDAKEKSRFIKEVERIVRGSLEYRQYIKYLKTNLNITSCTFMPGIDIDNIKGVKLEMHHYPLTLYDMVDVITTHYYESGYTKTSTQLNPLNIAHETMEAHYKNQVGLVPLSLTAHKMAHNGSLFIPLQVVFGNYTDFLKKYHNGMSDTLKESLSTLIELTDRIGDKYTPDNLDTKTTSIDVSEFDNFNNELEINRSDDKLA